VNLTIGRGNTARKDLEIDWNYPVFVPKAVTGATGERYAGQQVALDSEEVYELFAGDDRRPMLVLREFPTFDDPGNAKLTKKLYTEDTVLLSHWFNCVRLPHHVTQLNHPFHNLFLGERPPQLFLADPAGKPVFPFDYTASSSDLEKDMIEVLDRYYEMSPARVLGDFRRMLNEFDKLEKRIQNLREDLDKAIEQKGPGSSKARRLMRDLERAEANLEELEKRRESLREIPLRQAAAG